MTYIHYDLLSTWTIAMGFEPKILKSLVGLEKIKLDPKAWHLKVVCVCVLPKLFQDFKILYFADISWTEHSTLTTSRLRHSSAVVQDTIYLLGHDHSPAFKTTESLNIGTGGQAWTKSFDLQSAMDDGCIVKISIDKIMTIAGAGELSRNMFKYNVRTGDAVQYNNTPPTQVWKLQRSNSDFFNSHQPISAHCPVTLLLCAWRLERTKKGLPWANRSLQHLKFKVGHAWQPLNPAACHVPAMCPQMPNNFLKALVSGVETTESCQSKYKSARL